MQLPVRYIGLLLGVGLSCIGLVSFAGCLSRPDTQQAPGQAITPSTVGIHTNVPILGPNKSALDAYYKSKYSERENCVTATYLPEILPHYSKAQLEQAQAQILAFRHVVFHTTKTHHLDRNHTVVRSVLPIIEAMCRRYEVPTEPVVAIISWENSGSLSSISWANAAGIGQMTPGAVESAHAYGASLAERCRSQAQELADNPSDGAQTKAAVLLERAEWADCAKRHKKNAKQAGRKDERFDLECSIEDSVLFYAKLMEDFGQRNDLAISAYHNGVLNNDDIINQYARLKRSRILSGEGRQPILEMIELLDLKFVDLWNEPFTRDMLCGLRTVEGEITTDDNASMALGDESDLYVWKVLGSWIAFRAGNDYLEYAMKVCSQPWDITEVSGLKAYTNAEAWHLAESSQLLVYPKTPFQNWGIDHPVNLKVLAKSLSRTLQASPQAVIALKPPANTAAPPVSSEYRHYSWLVTPELAAYLQELTERYQQALADPTAQLPIHALSGAWAQNRQDRVCVVDSLATHQRGVAADLALSMLTRGKRRVLDKLLTEDYLHDVIYQGSHNQDAHIVLNPAWGSHYYQLYLQQNARNNVEH